MMLGKQALTQFLKRLNKGAMVLDIGDSNNSSAYKIMQDAGMKVKAVSLVEPADIVGPYESAYTSNQDAIWCCHCLEHIRNPGDFLDKIFADLNENGLLCITVPPAGNYLAGGHVTIWNEYTLLYQLVLAGFDCSRAWVRRYDYNISVLVQKETAKNDHYAEIGKRFEENLRDLQVPYDMEYVEPCQPYPVHERFIRPEGVLQKSEECRQSKVPYMIRKLNEHRKTIIWVDCDDKLLEPPVLPSKDFDVGFLGYRNGHKTRTVMANVLAFNPTENAKHFLKIWEYLNKWPELEASGDEHIRLCHAKRICFDVVNQAQKQLNYKEINLLDIVRVQLNGHRPESYMGKRRRVRRI